MKTLLLATILIAGSLGTVFAQKQGNAATEKGVAVAFIDKDRLRGIDGVVDDFQFFLKPIQEIVKRDFPGVELRIVEDGGMIHFPDGTALNVQNAEQPLGFVLSIRGKKRRVIYGIQTDVDFACAASSFFSRRSSACPK